MHQLVQSLLLVASIGVDFEAEEVLSRIRLLVQVLRQVHRRANFDIGAQEGVLARADSIAVLGALTC